MSGKLKQIHQKAAGIDVGASKFFVGIDGANDKDEVANFDTFTCGCKALVSYLKEKQITTVAMEATGIYWKVLHAMLVEAGIEVCVANGRHVKHVPGRKTDVKDCAWIKELHSYGLLRGSFIPTGEVQEIRHYMRIREKCIDSKSDAVRRMDKALVSMNIRISTVISDIQGKSGMEMIKAILEGERNVEKLAKLCDDRIQKTKMEDVRKSLEGIYKTEELFALQHAFDEYQFYIQQIAKCDKEIEIVLQKAAKQKPDVNTEKEKFMRIYHIKPAVKELDKLMMQIYEGKNLTVLPGVTSYTLLRFFSEVGTDFSAWPVKKQFTAALQLAPSKYQSGSSRRYKKIPGTTKAGQILKEAVESLLRSKNLALGAFGKKIAARRGPNVAIKAMARKLAEWIYDMVTKGVAFVEIGIKQYEEKIQAQNLKWLKRQANKLNLVLMNPKTAEII
jgi:transposase